jgi:methionyl-tRNA formyltransferase|tara:strand:+ start:2227 stop:3192 length:966 start_codon:yes stop_codon:yes gene_type:complete
VRILFAGTPEFAATHLKGLLAHAQTNDNKIVGVITQPDKPGKRGKQAIPSEVKKVAQAAGIPCEQPNKLQFTDIEAYQADLLIVVAYGQILRSDVLNGPRFGCINVHGSLLPRWRGAAPIQRAIEAGDTQTGINIIQMDKGLDTGDVLYSKAMPIGASTTAKTLSDALAPLGVEGLLSVISQIEQNTLQPLPQTDTDAVYAHKIKKEEAQLDWTKTNHEISAKIRAFYPDPICFSQLGEHRIKFHAVNSPEQTPDDKGTDKTRLTPGTVIEVTKNGVLVACGTGCISINKLQIPIGKGSILSGADIINARSDIIFSGVVFS